VCSEARRKCSGLGKSYNDWCRQISKFMNPYLIEGFVVTSEDISGNSCRQLLISIV
jgi:hypothetical protein